MNLTAHHLRFTLNVETPIELDTHPGAALRGMVFNALRGPKNNPALGFCTQRHLPTCADCALVAACPVAALVSTMDPNAERGRDLPRPYTIEPPLNGPFRYKPGDTLTFGLTLFGNALNLFPYVVMALNQAGPYGLGKKLPPPTGKKHSQRGRFTMQSAKAINLLTGEVQEILEQGNTMVQQPDIPVTHNQVLETGRRFLTTITAHSTNGYNGPAAYQHGQNGDPVEISLHFKTPARIIVGKKLLKTPHFEPIFHRLLDRLLLLEKSYGAPGREPAPDKNRLLAAACRVELVDYQTRWEEVWSYSARQGKRTPIGGLLGRAVYRAPRHVWQLLLPYLLWGQITHVGKNAVKGDGIIAVSSVSR